MKKIGLMIGLVLAGLLFAAAGGGVVWWLMQPRAEPDLAAMAEPEIDMREYRYVSLDKVIVMLRSESGEPLAHYMAVDLVFKTPEKSEKLTKQHLPLLRAVALKAMSAYTFDTAGRMTIEEVARDINRAYDENYATMRGGKPFVEAMIGKLIIE